MDVLIISYYALSETILITETFNICWQTGLQETYPNDIPTGGI